MGQPIRRFRTTAVPRGYLRDLFRARRGGRRIGHEETGAQPTRSNRRSRLTSLVAPMRTARTTRKWCSTPYREEVTPGLAARRCRNGSSVAPLKASMLRVLYGYSSGSSPVGANGIDL